MSKSEVISNDAVQQCKDEVTIQYCLGHHPFIVQVSLDYLRPDYQAGKLRCVKNQYFISLLQVYHYWQSKRNLYIVMEFVSHGELFSLWQRLPVFPEVSPYFCAVGYCYVTDHFRPDIDLVTIIHQCFGLSYSLPSFSPSVRI